MAHLHWLWRWRRRSGHYDQKPRAKNEPIINKSMSLGIVIQTITQPVRFWGICHGLGMDLEAGAIVPPGTNMLVMYSSMTGQGSMSRQQRPWPSSRSPYVSCSCIYCSFGKSLAVQVGHLLKPLHAIRGWLSIVLLLLVVSVPFLQPIFNTHFMSGVNGRWYSIGDHPCYFRGKLPSSTCAVRMPNQPRLIL